MRTLERCQTMPNCQNRGARPNTAQQVPLVRYTKDKLKISCETVRQVFAVNFDDEIEHG